MGISTPSWCLWAMIIFWWFLYHKLMDSTAYLNHTQLWISLRILSLVTWCMCKVKRKRNDWVTWIPVLSDVCIGLSVLSMLCALTVCIFTCVHLPIGAAGVPPSSPTLLFRRWVRKVESLISQPMTSGKNELQDHLIFISEKALHKRYFSFCQTSWSISWVYGMAYNLFLLNFMLLGDCNSRVSLCPTFSR